MAQLLARQSAPFYGAPRQRNWPIHLVLSLITVACVVPLILVVSASFTDEKALVNNGYGLLPSQFSTAAYDYLFRDPRPIFTAYGITIFVTVVGTAFGLLIMSMLAYVLSRKDFKLRKPLSFYVFFTMLFNGGLVPWYIVVSQVLHLKNTISVLILPYLVVPWFVLLLRTYFAQIPDDLLDAARIDGAGEWRIFFRIVIPLSTPALATVGLFCALMYWNDWWLPLLFIDDKRLAPLQYLLYTVSTNISALANSPYSAGMALPIAPVRMAMAVIAIGPIALAYVLVQRFFVRGITVGALK